MRHSRGEIVEVGDLRQHIVADDEVGRLTLGHQALRELQAEEFDQRRNILLARHFGDIGGRLDADDGNTQRQKMLKQISVVARDLEDLAFRAETKPGLDHFAILARMLDPRGRIRRKICVFRENMLRLDVLLQLHQEALAADEHVQRKVRLHLVDLVGSQKAFAKRGHPKINEGRSERGIAQATITSPKIHTGRLRAVGFGRLHRSYFTGALGHSSGRSQSAS